MPESAATAGNSHVERILAAATDAFLERGYEEASTADIARRAKVSKRELYSNFSDKRDILAAVITELQARIQTEANISMSSSGDLTAVLTRAGTQIFEFINSDRFGKLFRIVAAESFRDPVSAQKFYLLGPGMGRENTAAFIKRHMNEGNLRKADALLAADDFLDLVVSARHLTAVVLGQIDEVPDPRSHVKHAVDIFLNYYGTQDKEGPNKRKPASSRPRRKRQSP
jgi:AcrR family transcriptional regulator